MTQNKIVSQVIRIFLSLALVVGFGLLLWTVRFTIIYIFIAAIFALIGKPLVDFISGKKIKRFSINRTLAAAITLLLMVSILSGVFIAIIPSLLNELEALTNIDLNQLFNEVELSIASIQESITGKKPNIQEDGSLLKNAMVGMLNFENISDTFEGFLSGLGNLVFALFSVVFMAFFFLREQHLFRNIILALVPDRYEFKVLHVAPSLKNNLSRYFLGLMIQVSIVTTLVSISLTTIGFENTLVIGFFAGLLNLIPYIGPIIGMAFGLILGFSQHMTGEFAMSFPTLALLIIIVFASIQMIDNFVLQPIIFSNSINAHPLEIFIVISIAATLAGIGGMIVAVPVYSVIRLLAGEFFPQIKLVRKLVGLKPDEAER
jgi:predicted PurR-regulated permease PerM